MLTSSFFLTGLSTRQASCPLCKQDITTDDLTEDEESSGARSWFWSSWSMSGRTIVPTEEEDANDIFETPPGSPSRLEERSSPVTPLSDNERDTEAMVVPRETS
jgi:hypothetical protein